MQSFRRRLFASISMLLLICCLATVVLWVRSYWLSDVLNHPLDPNGAMLFATRGKLHLWGSAAGIRAPGWEYERRGVWGSKTPVVGFSLQPDPLSGVQTYFISVPIALLTTLFALAPTYCLLGPRRRLAKRHRLGQCLHCGYDLRVQRALSEQSESNRRATPWRCPECGRVA
jgi:hypothetical protein